MRLTFCCNNDSNSVVVIDGTDLKNENIELLLLNTYRGILKEESLSVKSIELLIPLFNFINYYFKKIYLLFNNLLVCIIFMLNGQLSTYGDVKRNYKKKGI